MPLFTRHRRRAAWPALLACVLLAPVLVGCGEDRSNLIPQETSESLIENLDRVQSLAASGQCFEAAKVALEAQREIEAMGPEVDPDLKRSLRDGVTDLTLMVNDPEKCTQADVTIEEEPVIEEEEPTEPEATTGTTGPTGPEPGTTGPQGGDDEAPDQDTDGNGTPGTPGNSPGANPGRTPTPPAPTPPTPAPTPTPTPTPTPGPGSGGLGPG